MVIDVVEQKKKVTYKIFVLFVCQHFIISKKINRVPVKLY